MNIEKAKIDSCIYDVITEEEYYRNPDIYDPRFTAIKFGDGNVYPIRNPSDFRPGFYPLGGYSFFKLAPPSEHHIYSQQNIINFSNTEGIREIIQAQQQLASEERIILTSIDNLFTPNISPNDKPEMMALKQSVIDKHIDIDKYEQRLGANFNNDKRLFRRDSISLKKLVKLCDALDIKVTMTFSDVDPNVPNPMNTERTVIITGNKDYIDDSDTEGE